MADRYLRDGWTALVGGMDSGTNPTLLPRTTAAFIINGLVRGGFLETRYGFKERPLIFANDEQEEWFQDNLFQGGEFFAPTERTPMFIVSVGGRIFKIDVLNGYRVTEITPVNGTLVLHATAVNYTGGTALATTTLTGGGAGLTVTSTVVNGSITSVVVVAGGAGYAVGDTFTIVDATGTGYVGSIGSVSGGVVTSVITSSFTSPPIGSSVTIRVAELEVTSAFADWRN